MEQSYSPTPTPKRPTIDPETGLGAWFASSEDTVLAKLEGYRLGGEASADSLKLDYLRRGAAELNLEEVLVRALKKSYTVGILRGFLQNCY